MASYKQALQWLADNDDCDWLMDAHGSLSVSSALVADLFNKTDEKVQEDLKKLIERRKKT